MSIQQPQSTDYLNSPDHALSHRVFANDSAAPVQSINVDSSGNVGIGTTGPVTPLHIVAGATTDATTGIRVQNVATDATTKQGRLKTGHYTNAEEPFTMLIGSSTATDNVLQIGGGSGYENVATYISFYTASNNTTLTGTERVRIDSSGNVGIGLTAPTAYLHLKAGTATASTAPLKLTSGTLNTTPEAGAIEYDGTNLYFVDGTGTRRQLAVV